VSSEDRPPFSIGRVFRELDARKVRARDEAVEAMTRVPEGTRSIVVRQREERPKQGDRVAATLTDVEAVTDAGHATLLSGVEAYGLDVLPAVLVLARRRDLVVEYRRDAQLLQRFDPELALMYRPSRPLGEALATLASAGYRVSHEGDAIAVAKDVRRAVLGWWVLSILLFPLALLWWAYFLTQDGLEALRKELVDCYVPGVRFTRRVVVAPTGLTAGEIHVDRSTIVAVTRFGDADAWVWVGVVVRDGAIGLGEAAMSPRQARQLVPEQIALADLLAHVLAEPAGAPYRAG